MKKINVAIAGYGNLGQAMEEILIKKQEYNLVAIFSRRKIKSKFKTNVVDIENINDFKGKIDIVFLTLGSYEDIEKFAPQIAKNFNIIDSFDTHTKLKNYLTNLNKIAKNSKTVAISAFGWDPGLMSLVRAIFQSIDSTSPCESFWGKGVSQGHSNAIRRLKGVKNAIQYTIPNKDILIKCKNLFDFTPKKEEKHQRLCYVAKENYSNEKEIKNNILSMPNYFLGFNTKVVFENDKQIKSRQKKLSHKGYVFKNFITCSQKNKLQFYLSTTSNPHFTAVLMIMGAKAVARLVTEKNFGAFTICDIPIKYFLDDKSIFKLL